MTSIRTLAVHQLVRRRYPRVPTERDEKGMAVGKAIDTALSDFNHAVRLGRRPTVTSIRATAERVLDDELAAAGFSLPDEERADLLASLEGVLRVFRRSDLAGLSRPRSRLILIGEEVGVYAQPDFWDGRSRFFELKTYLAVPPPPDVALQLALFQLAFPAFAAVLVAIDRHARPVTLTQSEIPPLADAEARLLLRFAYETALAEGVPKVLEYVDGPKVSYAVPAGPGAPPANPTPGP